MVDYNRIFNNPLVMLGAGMMAGADPQREGLGGLGSAILNTGQVMRDQARLDEESARARAAADLQMEVFKNRIAQQQREQQGREGFAAAYPEYAPLIEAGYGGPVATALMRPEPEADIIEPLTDVGQITRDVRQGFLTAEQGQKMMEGAMAGGDSAERTKQEWGVYKDVQKQEAPYREVASRANQILAAINAPGGFSDTTLVSNIAKFLDPTSVVRPSETQALSEAGGLVASIQGMLTNAAGKGFITPKQRAEIRSMMGRLTDIYQKEYAARRAETGGFMQRRGLSPDVMGRQVEFPSFQTSNESVKPVTVQTPSGGVRVRPATGGP